MMKTLKSTLMLVAVFNEFYLRFYARYDDIVEVVPVVEGPYRIDEARERMEFILSLTLEERGEVM